MASPLLWLQATQRPVDEALQAGRIRVFPGGRSISGRAAGDGPGSGSEDEDEDEEGGDEEDERSSGSDWSEDEDEEDAGGWRRGRAHGSLLHDKLPTCIAWLCRRNVLVHACVHVVV